jgi:hypothetical protein
MKLVDALRPAPIFVVYLIAAGCGALQTNPAVQTTAIAAAKPAIKVTNNWVFVSDPGSAQVFIYTLPRLRLIEIATGFTQPQGECSDAKGDVWVTDGAAKTIYELEHSGKIVHQLSDTKGAPIGCAWDTKTGNLAVTNFLGTDSQGGVVLVYHHASGVPNLYYNPQQFNYEFTGYDDTGNLFFDGLSRGGKFMLSELPANSTRAKTVKVYGGKVSTPGMVEWDASANDLVVGDQNCGQAAASCVYRMTITKNGATISGQTKLDNAVGGEVCDMIQGVLWKKSIVGSDFDFCGSGSSATYVWPYPQGGKPQSTNAHNVLQPFGAAISVGSKGD